MVYGVDECRRCGKPMKVTGNEAMLRYEKSLTQKPTMTEAEWRAAGWKAAPTRNQMQRVIDGLCPECTWHLGLRRHSRWKALAVVVIACIVLFGLVGFLFLTVGA